MKAANAIHSISATIVMSFTRSVCAAEVSQASEDDMASGGLHKPTSSVPDASKGNATHIGDSDDSLGGNMAGELYKHDMTVLSGLRHVGVLSCSDELMCIT